MKMPAILIGFGVMLMLSPLSVHAGSPDEAKPDPCALLKPADLTKLLGATPIARSNQYGSHAVGLPSAARGCSWTVKGSALLPVHEQRKLYAFTYKLTGPAEMAFMNARKMEMNVAKSAKSGMVTVTDEAGLGDKAFARKDSSGVALTIIKQGRLLRLEYWTKAKDLDALRPVAKKALEAF